MHAKHLSCKNVFHCRTAAARAQTQRTTRVRSRYRWLTLAITFLLSGCATLKEGAKQTIAIDTPDAPGAECAVSTVKGKVVAALTTPGQVRLRSRKSALSVVCRRDGFAEANQTVTSTFNKRSRFQGPEGMLVDAISGAMWRFPAVLSIQMRPIATATDPDTPSQPEKQP